MRKQVQRLRIWASEREFATWTEDSRRRKCRVWHYSWELASAGHLHVLRPYRIRNGPQRHFVDRQYSVRLLEVLFLPNRSKVPPHFLDLLH